MLSGFDHASWAEFQMMHSDNFRAARENRAEAAAESDRSTSVTLGESLSGRC
jgi:hypothetical protein